MAAGGIGWENPLGGRWLQGATPALRPPCPGYACGCFSAQVWHFATSQPWRCVDDDNLLSLYIFTLTFPLGVK